MPDINKPMDVPELNLQPPITGKVRLSEDMQQTLAVLCAMGVSQRVLLKASELGVLNTASRQIKDIEVFTAGSTPDTWQGGNIPCTEIAVIAELDNADKVWIRPYKPASAANGWPLNKGEIFGFAINNLNQLHVTIETTGQIAVIAYTR